MGIGINIAGVAVSAFLGAGISAILVLYSDRIRTSNPLHLTLV